MIVLTIDPKERARIQSILYVGIILITSPFGWIAGNLSGLDKSLPFILNIVLFGAGAVLAYLAGNAAQKRLAVTTANSVRLFSIDPWFSLYNHLMEKIGCDHRWRTGRLDGCGSHQRAGVKVDVYDSMPSLGRKFLLAGKGGLNITHSEPFEKFVSRYGERRANIEPLLNVFGPEELRDWVHGFGIETFVGTSGTCLSWWA